MLGRHLRGTFWEMQKRGNYFRDLDTIWAGEVMWEVYLKGE